MSDLDYKWLNACLPALPSVSQLSLLLSWISSVSVTLLHCTAQRERRSFSPLEKDIFDHQVKKKKKKASSVTICAADIIPPPVELS